MGDYSVVNLTGSTVHMARHNAETKEPTVQAYSADERVAQVRTVKVPVGEINGVPVYSETADILVDNIPDAVEGVVFVVPPICRAVLKGRRDVVAPDYSGAILIAGECPHPLFFGFVQ